MKVFLILFASVAAVTAGVPRPSGRIILLPARQQDPLPAEADTSASSASQRDTSQTQTVKLEDSKAARVLDSGEYYVLTPEGKLQMVKYSTAALRNPSEQPAQVAQQPEPFAQFQVEYFQYPGFDVSQSQTTSTGTKAEQKDKSEDADGYEANVQFRDVKPISAPIYAYNPEPLVRILKK